MSVFVDTSALFALLEPRDTNHAGAVDYLESLAPAATPLLTHDYVVVEATALVQRRLGISVVRWLHERLMPAITVRPVGPEVRTAAVSALLAANRRDVSLVDWVSFEVMRRAELREAFAFDADFPRQGFALVP